MYKALLEVLGRLPPDTVGNASLPQALHALGTELLHAGPALQAQELSAFPAGLCVVDPLASLSWKLRGEVGRAIPLPAFIVFILCGLVVSSSARTVWCAKSG